MAFTKVNKTVADLPNLSQSLILETVNNGIRSYIDEKLVMKSDISHTHNIYASLENPEFTGTPIAPTQPQGNRTTRIATTEFVGNEIDAFKSSFGMIRAYVVFGGTAGNIKKSKNILSIIKTATGRFSLEIMPNILTDGDYVVLATCTSDADTSENETIVYRLTTPAKTTTSLSIAITKPDGTASNFVDPQEISVALIE